MPFLKKIVPINEKEIYKKVAHFSISKMGKKRLPLEFILELANAHNGSVENVINLVTEFSDLNYENIGIKFQPFKYEKIALSDFEWYDTYKKLFIKEKDWNKIINFSKSSNFKVWLDIFDVYGCKILKNNLKNIVGVKLQASIVDNGEVFEQFKTIDLSKKKLIINISGFDISKIEELLIKYESLKFNEIILQIGFQHYPTDISDTSINKIHILRSAFPNKKICYADHLLAEEKISKIFPIIAYACGCEYIEKHVCLNRKKSKYDYFSSLEKNEIKELLNYIEQVSKCFSAPFISFNEFNYLKKSQQIPVLRKDIKKGQLISKKDIIYRRTKKKGLNFNEINEIQKSFYILKKDLNKFETVKKSDFKKSNIGVIVAGRMKSSRLKNKAILKINNIPSIELCLLNCLKIRDVSKVILASSTLPEDSLLKNYTLNGKVEFFQGHPDDVILRFLKASEKYDLDVIIRVTADCPIISPEIAEFLLKAHFEKGADYTAPKDYSVGTNCEIYNVQMLKNIIGLLGNAKHSEYMTWYAQNNADIFKINIVDLPKEYVRTYRLTLDYEEDLKMFNELFKKLKHLKKEASLTDIFETLDTYPEIPSINNHITLVYRTDKKLIEKLNKLTKIKY